MIRATAYWAIGQILGKKQEILSMQIMIKRDAEVQNEMIKGLDTRRE